MPKIMFNLRPPQGSFGGGSFFVKNMAKYLENKGFDIVYSLEPNIDLIFMIDPRKGEHKKDGLDEILQYKRQNPNCKVIYRVNECDAKRELSINIEPILVRAIKEADKVIFVSNWLMNYFIEEYNLINIDKMSYILNGVDHEIYNFNTNKTIDTTNKIKLVTHHFSNNYLKGFQIYNALDKLVKMDDRFKNVEFTYIGRYHNGYKPTKTKLLQPINGEKLAEELKKHDIYITATQFEPGAMHYLEGASCGLPVLYRKCGGGANEICSKFGLEYNSIDELVEQLNVIINNYSLYTDKIKNNYEYLGKDRCCDEFYEVIKKLI